MVSGTRKSPRYKKLKGYKANLISLYHKYKHRAKIKNQSFKLTKAEFESFIQAKCYCCGIAPANVLTFKRNNSTKLYYNGIDRIDNSMGYEMGNCRSACGRCNQMKSDLDQKAFLKHVKKIVRYQGGIRFPSKGKIKWLKTS